MALLNSWGLVQSFCFLLGPPQLLRMFQTFSLPLFPRASLPSYLKCAYSSGRLLLESSLPYASIRGDWVSQMHCLTMPSPAPIRGGGVGGAGGGCRAAPRRIRGAGPLWLARAEHRCQLPSVMIAYLWTFNLSKACWLAEGSRRFGVLNRFDNRHYHCEGASEKRYQRVNCGWRCKLSLLILFNTCCASCFLTSFSSC